MKSDRKLTDKAYVQQQGWGKVLNLLSKLFTQGAIQEYKEKGYEGLKAVYMPVIFNIDEEGTSNSDLARLTMTTKQAMNLVVKELKSKGYITSKKNPNDKRGVILLLTAKGKKFTQLAREHVVQLMDEYRQEIGRSAFDDMLTNMVKLVEYHQRKLRHQSEDE